MAYGLLNGGQSTKQQAMHGFKQDADAEQQRDIANENIKMAEEASDKSIMGTGASMGAMAGVSAANTAAASGALGSVAAAEGAGMATLAASGAASMGIGLIAAWALTELL